ncbi:MAG: hypothetical protein C0424_00155 [Sphingobacteriaceae bacterium]|nr:hypothetical protein [Sphingobacteriaceae bacterium]
MKTRCASALLFLSLLGAFFAQAQHQTRHAVYGSGQLATGNYYGLDLSANYVLDERHVFQLTLGFYQRRAHSIPVNYERSGFSVMPKWWREGPFDLMRNMQLTYGRMFVLEESGKLRAILSGGLALTRLTEPGNWRDYDGPSGGFGGQFLPQPNWDYDYLSNNRISLVFNPRIEFAFVRFYGFTLSPLIVVNSERTLINVGVGHVIGLVRKKTFFNSTQ